LVKEARGHVGSVRPFHGSRLGVHRGLPEETGGPSAAEGTAVILQVVSGDHGQLPFDHENRCWDEAESQAFRVWGGVRVGEILLV